MNVNKLLWVDLIRVTAIILVVLQHVATPLIFSFDSISIDDWWVANIFHTFSDVCVPLLFMISGYLLLNKNDSLFVFFSKRINKVLLPLIIWSIIYLFWNKYYSQTIEINLTKVIQTFITPAHYHLWFLYTILSLYLLIPVLRIYVKHASTNMQHYIIAIWFLSVSIHPFVIKLLGVKPAVEDLNIFSGYLGYILLGYMLGNASIRKSYFLPLILTSLILTTFTIIATYYATIHNHGVLIKYFHTYLSPNIIILSAVCFIILKSMPDVFSILHSSKVMVFIRSSSSASLGIYLLHVIIFIVIREGDANVSITPFSYKAIYSIPLLTLLVFLITFGIILIAKNIPVIKRCVP